MSLEAVTATNHPIGEEKTTNTLKPPLVDVKGIASQSKVVSSSNLQDRTSAIVTSGKDGSCLESLQMVMNSRLESIKTVMNVQV